MPSQERPKMFFTLPTDEGVRVTTTLDAEESVNFIEQTVEGASLTVLLFKYGAAIVRIPEFLGTLTSSSQERKVYALSPSQMRKRLEPEGIGQYVARLESFVRTHRPDFPTGIGADMRRKVYVALREGKQRGAWQYDDEVRAALCALLPYLFKNKNDPERMSARAPEATLQALFPHLQNTQGIKKFFKEVLREKKSENVIVSSFMQTPFPVEEAVLQRARQEVVRGRQEAKKISLKVRGRGAEWKKPDKEYECALIAALIRRGAPAHAISEILRWKGCHITPKVIYKWRKENELQSNADENIASRLEAGIPKDTLSRASAAVEAEWEAFLLRQSEDRTLRSPLFLSLERCASIVVLLSETDIPPVTILKYFKSEHGLDVEDTTLLRFVKKCGDRMTAADVILKLKRGLDQGRLDDAQKEVSRVFDWAQQRRSHTQPARTERNEAARVPETTISRHPLVNEFIDNVQTGKIISSHNLYGISKMNLFKEVRPGGTFDMRPGISVLLEDPLNIPEERLIQQNILKTFLLDAMRSMTKEDNPLVMAMKKSRYSSIQLREYEVIRNSLGKVRNRRLKTTLVAFL